VTAVDPWRPWWTAGHVESTAGEDKPWLRPEGDGSQLDRGLVEALAAFPVEDGPVMDALTFADMTTGPAGQPMTLNQRIEEVQRR
jgi:hypothetical protein